jgi:flagellar hook-associated protein 2
MATSSVSSTSSGANFVMALGSGSGVDIKALAENLVNAEKQPKAEIIQKAIDKNQARITGYQVVGRAVDQIKVALDALAQPSSFANFNSSSSQASAVIVSGSATAKSGQHEVAITQLARAQRSISDSPNSSTNPNPSVQPLILGTPAGSGRATVQIRIGSAPPNTVHTTMNVTAADTKPETIVQAINDAGAAVKASLVQITGATGGEVRIVLTGQTGIDNKFEATIVDANSTSLATFTTARAAQNAKLTVDGVTDIERSTNIIEGAIPGATLTLTGETTGSGATVSLTRDVAPVKEKIKQLVSAYNDLQTIINAAQDPASEVEKLGGSLAGDSSIRGIRDRIRSILLPTNGSSAGTVTSGGVTTPFEASGSSTLKGLRDFGVMIDTDGTMKFSTLKAYDPLNPNAQLLKVGDESALDSKLSTSFDEVAALFQGRNGKPGIASDMSDLVSGNGRYKDTSFTPSSPAKLIVATQRNARGYIQTDTDRMAALEERMKALLERYMKQFAVMDSLVGQSKSERTGIENSFEGMSNSR